MRWRKRTREDLNEQLVPLTEELWRKAEAAGVPEEKFVEAVTEGLDKSIEPFVDRLIRDSPAMLRNRRHVQRDFERRLRRRWRRGLDLYRATLEAALDAGGDFNDQHRPAASAENDFLFEALTRLHARACLTGFEVFTLLRTGYADAAYARWRTLHELAVVSSVLVHEGEGNDLAERYLLHEFAEHAAEVPSYQRHAPALGYEQFDDETVKQHRTTVAELQERFGEGFSERNGWAAPLFGGRPPNFAELEERAGLAHMRPWYRLTSHTVHAGSKGAALIVGRRGPYRFLRAGPSNADLADPGHGALIALTQVTTCLLLRTRTDSLAAEPLRIVVSKALLRLTELAGDAFLEAHKKLEQDEERAWANFADLRDGSP